MPDSSRFSAGVKPLVFISYSRKDGREFAHDLRTKLEAEGVSIWQDVVSETAGEGWWQNIVEAIEGSAVMILIFTEGALRSQVVRDEWLHARKIGTAILPVVPEHRLLSKLDERGEHLVPRWLERLDLLILDPAFPDYTAHWQRLLAFVRTPPPRRPVPFTVPALPGEFVHRAGLEQRILARLVEEEGFSPLAGVRALIGEGGFGKSTLAQAACRQPQVIEAFKDGILWLTLGEDAGESTVISRLNDVIEAFAGTPADKLAEARTRCADLLRERDCLIVLDDVWQVDLVEPFLMAESEDPQRPHKGCRAWLITSRFPEVSRYLGRTEDRLDIGEMQTDEAAAMLGNFVPEDRRPLSGEQFDSLHTLARQLGEWPLLLRLAGSELRQEMVSGAPFDRALAWVRDGLREEGFVAFDAPGMHSDSQHWRQQALSANVSLSLRRFDAGEQQRLFELTIFPPDTAVPAAVAGQLWGATGALAGRAAQKLLRRFDGPFLHLERAGDTFSFHDVLHAYLGTQLTDDARRQAHAALLRADNPNGVAWHTLPDDGYLYDHLAYHLHGAGRDAELQALFATPEWMHKRFEQSGYTYSGCLSDLLLAWEHLAHPRALEQVQAGEDPAALADCARYALIHTSINSLAGNYDPSLVARAVQTGLWTPARALGVARLVPDADDRAAMYVALAKVLEGEPRAEALEAALAIQWGWKRAEALAALAGQLEGEARQQALARGLEAALAIGNERARASALAALAGQLEGERLPRGLAGGGPGGAGRAAGGGGAAAGAGAGAGGRPGHRGGEVAGGGAGGAGRAAARGAAGARAGGRPSHRG